MRTIIGIAMAAFLLSACVTTGTNGPSGPDVSKVQAISAKICGYVPTAASIAKLATTFFGFASTVNLAESIAVAVCDALKNRPLSQGPLVVRGVRVRGNYVR